MIDRDLATALCLAKRGGICLVSSSERWDWTRKNSSSRLNAVRVEQNLSTENAYNCGSLKGRWGMRYSMTSLESPKIRPRCIYSSCSLRELARGSVESTTNCPSASGDSWKSRQTSDRPQKKVDPFFILFDVRYLDYMEVIEERWEYSWCLTKGICFWTMQDAVAAKAGAEHCWGYVLVRDRTRLDRFRESLC